MSSNSDGNLEDRPPSSMDICDRTLSLLSQSKRLARGFVTDHPETAGELLQALEIAQAAVWRLQAEIAEE